VDGSGTRRTIVAGKGSGVTALDDRPLSIRQSRDRKRLIVTLPYEIWIGDAKELTRQRVVEVPLARPSVAEDAEGLLWIGGRHLYRGSSWGDKVSKVGTKLGGFVDQVVLLRPDLLCGAGRHGEVLWNVDKEEPEHRRKASEHEVMALAGMPDERAVWADGSAKAWVIDPAHPQGYTQIHLRQTSPVDVHAEGITRVGLTTTGRCILGARDGGVAWTNPDLRVADERFPKREGNREAASRPLDVAGDERWIYVLRPRGLLQRFLIAQPTPKKKPREKPDPRRRPAAQEEEEPLPEAQSCRLQRPADCMCLAADPEGARQLVFGGAHADGYLGRLWAEDPEGLDWKELGFTKRELADQQEGATAGQAPSFKATRSKVSGPPLSQIKVDEVLAARTSHWLTQDHGALAERPTLADADDILAADTVLLPAMIRFGEGTARPALLLWPGRADERDEAPLPTWLTWGDPSSGWIALETPEMRKQRWSRTDLFPMQVALATKPPDLPGSRHKIPDRWIDPENFEALGKECKKLLKVLW
jgi:hypothetical protein